MNTFALILILLAALTVILGGLGIAGFGTDSRDRGGRSFTDDSVWRSQAYR